MEREMERTVMGGFVGETQERNVEYVNMGGELVAEKTLDVLSREKEPNKNVDISLDGDRYIYIFTSPKKPGIRLKLCTEADNGIMVNNDSVSDYGLFSVYPNSLEYVEWKDVEKSSNNGSKDEINTKSNNVFIVSNPEYDRIENTIKSRKDENIIELRINNLFDEVEKVRFYSELYSNDLKDEISHDLENSQVTNDKYLDLMMHHDSESLSTHKKSENEYLNPRERIEELEKIKNKFLDAYDKQENDLDNYNNTYLNHKNSGFGL